jgi:phage tail-like protein
MSLLPRLGPLPAFNFYIVLIDDTSTFSKIGSLVSVALGGFSECTGLESELSVIDYQEGGVNDRVHRCPGRFTFPNIVLSRGVGFGEDLYLWHEKFLKGEGKRRNGLILLGNEMGIPIKTWTFERGIPVKWVGPSLNAQQSALAIEKLEIAHEKLSLVVSPGKIADEVLGAVGSLF